MANAMQRIAPPKRGEEPRHGETRMLEASRFSTTSKNKLNRSRHERSIWNARTLEDVLRREPSCRLMPHGMVRPDPIIVAALCDKLQVAMSSAPTRAIRHEIWTRYCEWQAKLVEAFDSVLAWLRGDPVRIEMMRWIYDEAPNALELTQYVDTYGQMIRFGLCSLHHQIPSRGSQIRTAFGRLVAVELLSEVS